MQLKDFAKIYFALLLLHLVTLYKQDFAVLYRLTLVLVPASLLFYFLKYNKAYTSNFKKVFVGILLLVGAAWFYRLEGINNSPISVSLALYGLAYLGIFAIILFFKYFSWPAVLGSIFIGCAFFLDFVFTPSQQVNYINLGAVILHGTGLFLTVLLAKKKNPNLAKN